jgi:hypothetical protein
MTTVPRELQDDILRSFLSGVDKIEDPLLYSDLRNGSRLCRRGLGNQEHAQLWNDKEIQKFNRRSKHFNAVFQGTSINFGSLYFLEINMPTNPSLSHNLGHALATSKITHLNLHCGRRQDFLHDLGGPDWTKVFKRLRVFRIKYICSIEEVRQSSCSCGLFNILIFRYRTKLIPIPGIMLFGFLYCGDALLLRCSSSRPHFQ